MSTNIKATKANLEREERAITRCFDDGEEIAGSLREHMYNIKRHELWASADFKSFKDYCQSGRITMGKKKIAQSYNQLRVLSNNGQIEQYIPKKSIDFFNEESYRPLVQLRIEKTDDATGKVTKTHDLDVKRIKAVIAGVIAAREKAIAKPGAKKSDGQITASAVKTVIDKKYGAKPVKTLFQLMKVEQTRATKFLDSLEALIDRPGGEFLFSDAEDESPGCAKRLATAYSKIASFLRKV